MKILYREIKKLVPGLKADARLVGEALTMAGLMMDGLEKVRYRSQPDYLLSFEVRQNRPDCLSIFGLAREVAAYYGLKLNLPKVKLTFPAKGTTDIQIEAKTAVKRVLAIEIDGLKNRETPKEIKDFLGFNNINSINLLVDISNLATLYTGYPCHLLDKSKIEGGRLYWSLNKNYKTITTLDGSEIALSGGEIMLRDQNGPLGLAGIVGGKKAAIGLNTTSIIAEMAIYDRALVRRDARKLKVVTEASTRLEKDLDPNGLDYALRFLVAAIIKNCEGKIIARPFSYYPKKYIAPAIKFDPNLPSIYAGIKIPPAKAVKILKNLGFKVNISSSGGAFTPPCGKGSNLPFNPHYLEPNRPKGRGFQIIKPAGKQFVVFPPEKRMDVVIKEDVVEEVVRLYGYEKIPQNEAPEFIIVENITSKTILLAEKIRDILCSLGFDEILSLPLIGKGTNGLINYRNWESITTQNSVNEEYPDLRQSLAGGLLFQLKEYQKKNVEKIQLFEIGRVFGKENSKYRENEALGILLQRQKRSLNELKRTVETILRLIGFTEISYRKAEKKPLAANPYSAWEIMVKGSRLGILYKIQQEDLAGHLYFAEINLSEAIKLLENFRLNPVVELNRKLVVLDANVELREGESIDDFLFAVKKEIGDRNLWSAAVIDVFPLKDKGEIRYTIRVSYRELSDEEAKEKHLKVFGLENTNLKQ